MQLEKKDKVFNTLLDINSKLSSLDVSPSFAWAMCFDTIKDIHTKYSSIVDSHQEQVIAEGVTLKQIFDKFYDDIDSLSINMNLGIEIIEEIIYDWMLENDFLVALDNDGWLDDKDEE